MADNINYGEVLNPAQLEAVMAGDGPILVIAGAGSGKTRTLVFRVARLADSGVRPQSILLLTFTRKAAQQMLDRAASLSQVDCRFVSGGTFHSLAFRVLRENASLLGYASSFSILDRADMEEVLRSLVPELEIPKDTPFRFPKTGTLANVLSKSANLEIPVQECMSKELPQFVEAAPIIARLGALYENYKKAHQLMDYDDLIISFQRLLRDHRELRQRLGQQYTHILVDEYQDTNSIQAEIVKWLGHEHGNVMVVGDDAQSIYSFRGANYRNMFEFPELFPNARIIKLEQNYRSTQPILSLTNALMAQARDKFTKCLFTQREGGEKPRVVNTGTEHEQALLVARYLRNQVDQGRAMRDFAVLFRAAYQSFELEAELARQRIPYVKYGGFKFLESAHIKDFLAHLRVVVNPDEAVSWLRVLRLIKNIGHGKAQAIFQWMSKTQALPERLAEWPGLNKSVMGLKPLGQLMKELSAAVDQPLEAVEKVMAYYVPLLKEKYDDYPRRQKEVEELIHMAGRYKKLRGFLDDLVLEPPGSQADLEGKDPKNVLTLSTVHSAKGLEWSEVMIIWAMEGRFPPSRSYKTPEDLEEERRLMYVAATRARDRLFIVYPGQESLPSWMTGPEGSGGLSSFIADLPSDLFDHISGRSPWTGRGQTFKKPSTFAPPAPSGTGNGKLSKGDRVRHPAFGRGVVSRLVSDDKVEVLFKEVGRKLLHLEYTKLVREA